MTQHNAPEHHDEAVFQHAGESTRANRSPQAKAVRRFLDGGQEIHSPYGRSSVAGFDNDNINYLDPEPLTRPIDMPNAVKKGTLLAMAVAAVIGGFILFKYFDAVVNAPAREAAALEEMLSENVDLSLPDLAAYMPLDDASIMADLQASGFTLFEKTPLGTLQSGGFDVIKLTDEVSLADAGVMYASGLGSLSAYDAARLLNGSWDLEVSREDGTNLRVRYADFGASSVEEAVQRAIEAEGLADAGIDESGVDESGNTYAAGTIERDGTTYSWRASAIPLKEVYSIKDLPPNTFYVGIRMSAA